MNRWIVLPYDDSAVAREAVRRAAHFVRGRPAGSTGIMLAVAALDTSNLGTYVERAAGVSGGDVTIEGRLIGPGDAGQGLCRLAESLPDAELAVPLGARGSAHWCHWAIQDTLLNHSFPTVAFFIKDESLPADEEQEADERYRVGWRVGSVLRGCARLRVGVRALVRKGAR